jgi:hypothetical protein
MGNDRQTRLIQGANYMKLIHKKLPDQILKKLPPGTKRIKKQGQDFLLVQKLYCPQGHNLMVDSVRIHGEPSIRIHMKIGKTEGLVFVDAFWGGHAKLYNFIPNVKSGRFTEITCPVCGTDMVIKDACTHQGCRSDRGIVFHLPGKKNRIFVCAKLGCPGHRIDIANLPHEVSEEVSEINFIDAQEEDLLLEI